MYSIPSSNTIQNAPSSDNCKSLPLVGALLVSSLAIILIRQQQFVAAGCFATMGLVFNVGLGLALSRDRQETKWNAKQKFIGKIKTLTERAKQLKSSSNEDARKPLLHELNLFIQEMQNQPPAWKEEPVSHGDFGSMLLLLWSILETPNPSN